MAAGFTAMKFKVGSRDPERDLRRAQVVREVVGDQARVMVIERLLKAAKAHGFEVFISPHYFYPTDKGWKFNGPLEAEEAASGYFARKGPLESRWPRTLWR
ncbi:MAG: Isochorismatase [Pedosphaera sp.]|nr:Isochorismatase [Pedosphaera sp.]